MNGRRVVITGTGVVSALGMSRAELFENLLNGRSAIRRMEEWGLNLNGGFSPGAPVVLGDAAKKKIPRLFRRSMGDLSIFASLAAMQALEESGLEPEAVSGGRCGCVIGSTMGSSKSIAEAFRMILLEHGMADMPAAQFFKCASHTASFNVANLLNITGCVQSASAACASGLQAVGTARCLIAYGAQDIMICGGADELSQEVTGSFDLLYAGASEYENAPECSSRPFDARRTGLVCGEGAGILVLEEYEHARKRGAEIFAEIAGYATCGCGSQISQSDASSIRRCLALAYRDAGIAADSTDYISAHATATVQGDAEEAKALRDFFGADAVPASSLKGHLGHTLGASGVIETIAALEMMNRGILLPTLNLESVAEECSGVDRVRTPREHKVDVLLKNSFAFGGINAALICVANEQ